MAGVRPRVIIDPIKTLSTIILFSLLLFRLVDSDTLDTSITGSVSVCLANYTAETLHDEYKANLQTLLTDLASASATTSFHNTTAGESHGIHLCRGDVITRPNLCHSCVTNLTQWVASFDANCTERVAYSDYCMLRYANYSFFGKADDRDVMYTYDKFASTFSDVYNRSLASAIERVTTIAAYNSSTLFATYEAPAGGAEKVYALAQCTPDLDKAGCHGCLKAARSYLEHNVTRDPKFAWAILASCQLRYDNASFFAYATGNSNSGQAPAPAPFIVATLVLFALISSKIA